MSPLRITVHDFVGHAFQTQLSRELARRGHSVQHVFFSGFKSPNDRPSAAGDDPATFLLDPVHLPGAYPKYDYFRRYLADRRYLKKCISQLAAFRPDVVLSANASPMIQSGIQGFCKRNSIGFVNWVQDCYGIAAEKIFTRRLGPAGALLGKYVRSRENQVVHASDRVVLISDDFHRAFPRLERGKAVVIENWAPLEALTPRPKVNPWSVAQGLAGKKVCLYSGTLGLKHNPELLVQLAVELRGISEAVVAVVSEGLGRQYLEARKQELQLSNLRLIDFQPHPALPDVTAAADVLIAMVEKDAGAFSVPSKVLTYLCAGRPLLVAVPQSNLAARIVTRNDAGLAVDPDDTPGFLRCARQLLADQERARQLAAQARAYAETTFDIARIAKRFESVLFESLPSGQSAGMRIPAALNRSAETAIASRTL